MVRRGEQEDENLGFGKDGEAMEGEAAKVVEVSRSVETAK